MAMADLVRLGEPASMAPWLESGPTHPSPSLSFHIVSRIAYGAEDDPVRYTS